MARDRGPKHRTRQRSLYGDGRSSRPTGRIPATRSSTGHRRAPSHSRPNPTPACTGKAPARPPGAPSSSCSPPAVSDVRSGIILDAAFVPEPGGEGLPPRMTCLKRTARTAGFQAVVYDTALRGTHHQPSVTSGLSPVNRVTAARAGSEEAAQPRRATPGEDHPRRDQDRRRKAVEPGTPGAEPSASASSTTRASSTSSRSHGSGPTASTIEAASSAGTTIPAPRRWPGHRPPSRQRRGPGPQAQPGRERPTHPDRPRLRRAVPPAQRRRVHQPGPRRHLHLRRFHLSATAASGSTCLVRPHDELTDPRRTPASRSPARTRRPNAPPETGPGGLRREPGSHMGLERAP